MRRSWVTAMALVLGSAATTRADLLVRIEDKLVAEGGNTFVDVFVSSTDPNGDRLASFGFEFLITPTGPRRLEFVNPQSDAQLGLPDYVFFGNSADVADMVAVGAVSSTAGGTNDRFVGGDDTADGSAVMVTGERLLARLDLTAATGSAPIPGDTFLIALTPEGGGFSLFLDDAGAAIPFTSAPGTVTVTVVPEPGCCLLLMAGGMLVPLIRRRRLRASVG